MTRRRDAETLDGRELLEQADVEAESAEAGLRRGNLLVAVVGVVFVLAAATGAIAINRAYPPPSPPNTATQQQLRDLRADLDQYLAGRGGLRDQQYAKTVYTLCQLARDTGNADVLDDYDCAAVLAAPSPAAPSTSSTMTTVPGAPPRASTTQSSADAPAASSSTTTPATTSSPTASSPARTTAAPSTPAPVPTPAPLVSGVLCTLPILTLCPGG